MERIYIFQKHGDGGNTDFLTNAHETSADGGEANSDGDKRDVKQRW